MEPRLKPALIPDWIWLTSILAVAVGLRVAGMGSHSLWFDEVVTMRLARQPDPVALGRLIEQIDATRAPLHPLVLQGWLRIFGPSDLAGRALSALLGSLAVALVYWVGREAFDRATALWGTWLLAISPLAVAYSQEVRMYAWLAVLTCGCWGILLSTRRSAGPGKQVAYTLGLIALVYSHPLGGLMIVALALGYGVLSRESRLTGRSWFLIHVALVLAFAPWALRYLDHPPDFKYPRDYQALNWPKAFIGNNDIVIWICYAVAIAGSVRIGRQPFRVRFRDPSATLVCLIWCLIPPLLLGLYSSLRHPISGPIRYVLYVAPAFLLLVARGLARLPRVPQVVLAVAIMVLAGRPMFDWVYAPDAKPNWRAAGATVNRVAPGSSVILFCPNGHFYLPTLRYYLDPRTHLAAVYAYKSPTLPVLEPGVWYVVDRIDGIHQTPPLLAELYEPVQTWTFGRLMLTFNRLRTAQVADRRGKAF